MEKYKHLQGRGTSWQHLHTSHGTDMVTVQCASFCTQNSGLWIHGHRDLLTGMAYVGRTKEAALQSQHGSHHSCLRKTKVKAQLQPSVFWGLTRWSSSYLLAWWVGQWCPQQSRTEGTREGLGKRQRKLIPFLAMPSFRLRIHEEGQKWQKKAEFQSAFYRNI